MSKIKNFLSDFLISLITFNYAIIKREISKVNKKNIEILDLGCGTGTLALLFSPKKYLGIDVDKGLINYAIRRHGNYNFLVGDATSFKVERRFDLILVVGVIHHLSDTQSKKTLRNIKKHLKPQGRVLIIEAIPPIYSFNLLGKFLRFLDKGEFVRNFEEYYDMLAQVFVVKEAKKISGGLVDYGTYVVSNKN